MSQPKVSILIPIYNTEKYLRECLDSVISQTLEDIEIICVNDGSTDGSKAILQEYAEKDNRIQIIDKEKNEGTHLARKTAVLQSNGQYICFIDPDDSFSKSDSIETMVNLIEQEKTDILQFSVEVSGDVPDVMKTNQMDWLKVYSGKIDGSYNIISACIDNRYSWNLWNKIYRAEICKQAYQYVKDIHLITAEDAYGYFLIGYHADTFKGIKTEPLYRYRLGDGSTATIGTTLSAFRNYVKEISIIPYLEEFLKSESRLEEFKPVLNALKQRFQSNTLKRFEELRNEDVLDAFQVFKDFYSPDVLLDQYSNWKETKYQALSRIGLAGYQKKAELQKKLGLVISWEKGGN